VTLSEGTVVMYEAKVEQLFLQPNRRNMILVNALNKNSILYELMDFLWLRKCDFCTRFAYPCKTL